MGIDIGVSPPLHWTHSTGDDNSLSIENCNSDGFRSRTLRHLPHNTSLLVRPRGIPGRANISTLLIGLGAIVLFSGCDQTPERPLGPDPLIPTMSIDEAKVLLSEERWEEATDALRPYVSQPKPDSEILMMYARALVGSERHTLAVWSLQRLVEREDAPPVARHRYVAALAQGGDEHEAIRYASEVLDENPENLRLLDLRSRAYEKVLNFEAALEDAEAIAAETPERARVVERVLNLLIKVEDWDGARERIDELRSLLERDGVSPGTKAIFCATTSQFERDRENQEAAEKQLRDCLEVSPGQPPLVFALSDLLDVQGRVEEATKFVEGVVETFPNHQLLRDRLAARYAQLGEDEKADATLVETAELLGNMSSWLSLANLRASLGDLEGAVVALDSAVEIAVGQPPADADFDWSRLTPDSRFGIGDIYVRAKRYDRSHRIIESLTEEPAMALLLGARIKLDEGDPAAALADYQEAFKTFPSNPAARYLAGRAAVEVNEFDLAIDLYQDALRSDAAGTDAGLVLGQMLIAEGRFSYAIDTLGFFLVGHPHEPHAIRAMGQAGSAAGMLGFAEKVRLSMAPDSDWLGLVIADHAADIAKLSSPAAAIAYLESSSKLDDPKNFEAFSAWIALAKIVKSEQVESRIATYLTDHKDTNGASMIASRVHYEAGENDEALTALDRAIELNPLLPFGHAERGKLLVEADRLEEALESFDRARELDPLDARAWFSSAEALADAGRQEEAAVRLRELLIDHPWHARAALMLVDLHAEHGVIDDELAYSMARRAARYVGLVGPRAHLVLAGIELERGEAEDAARRFKMMIDAQYEVQTAALGLARSFAAMDRQDDAIEQLELILGASPNEEDAAVAQALLDQLKSGGA